MRIDWVTSETSFRALDTSNFSRETFSIAYANAFSSLETAPRAKINREDKSVANGMLPMYAQSLYQRLYRLRHLPPPDKPTQSFMFKPIRNYSKRARSRPAFR